MTSETVAFKPHFGAFVLETLTLGMYGESRNAIREYVQNGFDSLRQSVNARLINEADARIDVTLDVENQLLIIKDNGAGLRTENAVSVLASVGASNKNYRRNAGFRGIGRLAGIVFCDKLTFTTKARGQAQITKVVFDAAALRSKLSPHGASGEDAATTLASCVTATLEDTLDVDKHYFEVRLEGFVNPPQECQNLVHLRSFLSQVSPLPYRPDFPHGEAILAWAKQNGGELECIRMFVGDSREDLEELYKPYSATFGVKSQRVALNTVDFVRSDTGRWWGWIGRKKTAGSIKDDDSKGIRIRVRNIQIDGTDIMKDIFAVSRLEQKSPRPSYARLVDWYPGEIFINSNAAVPNARRDGFEEDADWLAIRNELDLQVASVYGKAAYRTSTADQLSVDNISKRFAKLEELANPMIAASTANWDEVSQAVSEAAEIQSRLKRAVKTAEDGELDKLRAISERVSTLKSKVDALVTEAPGRAGCESEVAAAMSELTQRLYGELQSRLAPSEWQRVREILEELTGEAPL
jgi:molecular chaperone HtpG